MWHRVFVTFVLVACLSLVAAKTMHAQHSSAMRPAVAAQVSTGLPSPETVAVRKAAVEAQLKELAQSSLPKEDIEATRSNLEQLLKLLIALTDALHNRTQYLTQIDTVPQQLRQLTEERKVLEGRAPRRFPQVTEQLRDDAEAELHSIRTDLQGLNQQSITGESRVGAIARELAQLAKDQAALEKALSVAQSKGTQTGETPQAPDVELLHTKLQLLRAESEALQAERAWLSQRRPLQDALLAVTQARLKAAQQDFDTIKEALSTVIQHEQTTLSGMAAALEEQLEHTADPGEALRLAVQLETIELQQATADYRTQLNQLGDDFLMQERRIAKVKHDLERVTSLVDTYGSGEGIAQRLLVAFEHVRRERLRVKNTSMKAVQTRLVTLSDHMFALDDRLYEFPQESEKRVDRLRAVRRNPPAKLRDADVAELSKLLDDQRTALREQQQVLTSFVQDHTKLLVASREYKRQLDESYLFILTQMFWLRDGKALTQSVLRDMVTGAMMTGARVREFLRLLPTHMRTQLTVAWHLWFMAFVVFLVMPWCLYRMRQRLHQPRLVSPGSATVSEVPPRFTSAAGAMLRASLWPMYLILVARLLQYVLSDDVELASLGVALVRGLEIWALLLGGALIGRALLRQHGWGQHFWGISPELCRVLRHTLVAICVAAMVLLVPRHIMLTAPGDGDTAVGSLALARACFLLFQGFVVLIVAILGHRNSLLMRTVLARSREQEGLWWRIWPLVHVLMVAGVMSIIVLDVLGYRYAARFIWFRALGSLSVVLTLRLLLVILLLRLLHRLVNYVFSVVGFLRQRYPDIEAAVDHAFGVVRTICNALLAALAVMIILELWGVSVTWFLTSPLGSQILTRTMIIAVAIGLTLGVIQSSNALRDYLIQPKTTGQGLLRQPSRKRRTLVPLVQTVLKVCVVFVAVLVILEQLGVTTGPVLTGVGIFGLAVGFASQSLIKDVINGLFILFEDSLSVGDIVTLRGTPGLVERVTLRAVTIRDLSGNVHLIPNSTIDLITNMSKEYSRYIVDVRVGLSEDVDRVIAVMREADESMRADPGFAPEMLEPIEVQGLDRFEEYGMIIRARLKTRPLQQFRIGREFNRRMKKAFDAHGIEIPVPRRTLYWGGQQDGTPPATQMAPGEDNLSHVEG